ncbi:hypothetical protein SARC_11676 [Sphaeroforma arctica JP610]|uniref:DUF4189 domain-containing protein n=1 Tax=Sphaeroforma arctica JP610 TaxID=667725 RepID=A0A0L0FGB0_9EUKA|nr:hypothetical protein SARC_11676 [Sphaeroforma arctica JP610]KNC75805.1 hypothetical protein SARC_11676 [Sphaeroforma arctica JP610]|eukprot:XP_014149707.1 hypothetical protein SARC_11676 [Sphaeroforma arctica JP610]
MHFNLQTLLLIACIALTGAGAAYIRDTDDKIDALNTEAEISTDPRNLTELSNEAKWQAIAVNPNHKRWGIAWDYSREDDAKARALTECGEAECVIRGTNKNGCLVYAYSPGTSRWGSAGQSSYSAALSSAIASCGRGDCTELVRSCKQRNWAVGGNRRTVGNCTEGDFHTGEAAAVQGRQEPTTGDAIDTEGESDSDFNGAEPDKWQALAMNPNHKRWGKAWNYQTEDGAKAVALQECGQAGCVIRGTIKDGCLVYTYSPGTTRWGWAGRSTYSLALTSALATCGRGDCVELVHTCKA